MFSKPGPFGQRDAKQMFSAVVQLESAATVAVCPARALDVEIFGDKSRSKTKTGDFDPAAF